MENLSTASTIVRLLSVHEATQLRSESIGAEHLFLALCHAAWLNDRDIEEYGLYLGVTGQPFQRLKFEIRQLRAAMENSSLEPRELYSNFSRFLAKGKGEVATQAIHRNEQCREVFGVAERLAKSSGSFRILPIHLLWAIVAESSNPAYSYLCEMDINLNRLTAVCEEKSQETFVEVKELVTEKAPRKKTKTPFLDMFGRDLTARAEAGEIGEVIGREIEIEAICAGLARKDRSAVVLLGDAGVGKTCVVEGLARAIVLGTLPDPLKARFGKMRVIEISMGTLVAGTQFRGQFEERVQSLIDEGRANLDSVIIFVDEVHLMMGAGSGGQGAMDAANLLKPALSRREMNFVGATTTTEYARHIEKDTAMDTRLEKVYINEPTKEEALAILNGLRHGLESHYDVHIDDEALTAAVEFSICYITNQRLPRKMLDVIHQACANKLCSSAEKAFWSDPTSSRPSQKKVRVTLEDVAEVVSAVSRIPKSKILGSPNEQIRQIREYLRSQIKGQDEAVEVVCDVILRAQQKLTDPDRPDGVFLLLGPTGVGKTELVKSVARALFGEDKDHFVELDMSDYDEPFKATGLAGAPKGYVGYEEEGALTGPVRRQPYCVVLLDEIEKAHPQIFPTFLQVFEEGRLMDTHGRRADFRNALIFMTSNLGASVKTGRMGPVVAVESRSSADRDEYCKRLFDEVKRQLHHEFIGRIDNVVCFSPLGKEAVRGIADKLLSQWRERLRNEHGLTFELTTAAYSYLMEQSRTDEFGARELRHVIDKTAIRALSRFLSEGEYARGDNLVVDLSSSGELVVTKSAS